MPLNEAQRKFIKKYLGNSFFTKKSDAKKISEYEAFLETEAKFLEVNNRVPLGSVGKTAVIEDHLAALAYRDDGKFKQANAAIKQVYAAILAVEQQVKQTRADLLKRSAGLTLAAGATKAEQDFLDTARKAITDHLKAELPTPDDFAAARKELEKAALLVARTGKLKDLHDRNPAAAAAAHLAFDSMRAKTGGGEITPERIKEAEKAAAAAHAEVEEADKKLKEAEALPVNSIDEAIERMSQIVDAREAKEKAEKKEKEAKDLANALIGTQMLTEQLESGPLSGKGGARKMPDEALKELIAGFENHPRLAADAVGIANAAMDPVAVAKGLATVGAQLDSGFKSAKGDAPKDFDAQAYAKQIMEMGGTCGGDYFDRLDDYVRMGGLVEASPLPDSKTDELSARGQKRSVAAAAGMLDDKGKLALGSDEAKTAIGHMLFHPDAIENATPALNKHVLETVKLLSTEPGKSKAETILAGVTPPPPGKSGSKLVNSALGKTGDPTDNDARQAVLAAMLQSVDQGPVGSCFATAPTRRLRMNDPLTAMEKYKELAVDGTFTTAGGTKVPAVTNLPPGEDPLIRSLEYSLATAVGRETGMVVQQGLKQDTKAAAHKMKAATKAKLGKDAGPKTASFLVAIRNEFSTVYDPMVKSAKVAKDGSSDRGRYLLIDSGGNEITTRDQYKARAVEVALSSTGYDKDSEEGKAVVAAVENDFMAELDKKKAPPWNLASGGFSEETMVALTPGATGLRTECIGEAAKEPSTPAEVGARTKSILTGLLDKLGPNPSATVAVDTAGMHDFSLTADSPSMQEFLSGPGSTAQKIQDKLVKPGSDLAKKALTVEEAQKTFDDILNPEIAELEADSVDSGKSTTERKKAETKLKQLKANIATHRPTAPVTPKDLKAAIGSAVKRVYRAEYFENKLQRKLVQEYSEPQIVLADTNWGDAESHTFFVVAPDPISGEPMLWQKSDPPGSMSQLGGDWLQASWGLLN